MKKCRVCSGHVAIELRQHNSAFCPEHFIAFCNRQVEKAIHKFKMFPPEAKVLVAVSGGKDSLALWDILNELGYAADGLVIGLGIGDYSDRSTQFARDFATSRGLTLHECDLSQTHGFTVPEAAEATKRVPCSACGLSKRHIFDSVAIEKGYDVVVTGHNLDDEAAVLFGNVIRWQSDYLARQYPVLPAGNGFPLKTKPLVRLGEREMAAYCVLRNIDYVVEECPMAAGNKHLEYKDHLNRMEVESPGAKHNFYFGFLDRASELFAGEFAEREQTHAGEDGEALSLCRECGQPSSNDVCAFCKLVDRVAPKYEASRERVAVPVEIVARPDMLDT